MTNNLPAIVNAFENLTAQLGLTVAPTSNRVYQQTYASWLHWCRQSDHDPFDLRPGQVIAFLASQDNTKATRQRQLSALRKLAQLLYVLQPNDATRAMYEGLKIAKAPTPAVSSTLRERTKRSLTAAQAEKALGAWNGASHTHQRNRALIAVLLLSGMRRSEVAALLWDDIDFEGGTITIRHGKGDKSRIAPLAGDLALACLTQWKEAQPLGRQFVFCPVERGDHLGKDKPISGTDVYRIVAATTRLTGVVFKPHDARRTFITEALETGVPLATVQMAAGHARAETTLIYARAVDAKKARKQLNLRYGT